MANKITITWDLPTTRVDGSSLSLSEIDHLTLYESLGSDPANNPRFNINPSAQSSIEMTGGALDTPGMTINYRIKVVDTSGRESVFSNTVSINIPTPVQNLTPNPGVISATLGTL